MRLEKTKHFVTTSNFGGRVGECATSEYIVAGPPNNHCRRLKPQNRDKKWKIVSARRFLFSYVSNIPHITCLHSYYTTTF